MIAIVLAIILIAATAYGLDQRRFCKRIRAFELRARDYIGAYADVQEFITKTKKEEPEVEFFEWIGMIYHVYVNANETETQFYGFMKKLGEDVLKAYDEIGSNYMSRLNVEMSSYIYDLHKKVLRLYGNARYQCWLSQEK